MQGVIFLIDVDFCQKISDQSQARMLQYNRQDVKVNILISVRAQTGLVPK